MKAWQVGGIILCASAVAILSVSSEARDSLGDSWRRLTGDAGQACFDYQRTLLKDPYSARFDSYSVSQSDDSRVTIKYHAKNSYGAYSGGEALCRVTEGKVDTEMTQLSREMEVVERQIQKLDAVNQCLAERNSLLLRGRSMAEATKAVGGDCSTNY